MKLNTIYKDKINYLDPFLKRTTSGRQLKNEDEIEETEEIEESEEELEDEDEGGTVSAAH